MAGRPTGNAKTGGRKRGTPNKRMVNRERAVAAAAEKIAGVQGHAAFEGAHAFLMTALSDKIGPIAHGIRLARQDGIPSEDQAMTVRHSANAAERLCL